MPEKRSNGMKRNRKTSDRTGLSAQEAIDALNLSAELFEWVQRFYLEEYEETLTSRDHMELEGIVSEAGPDICQDLRNIADWIQKIAKSHLEVLAFLQMLPLEE